MDLREMAKRARSRAQIWELGRSVESRMPMGHVKNRIFARTSEGYYVLGPKVMKPGDIVCVLFMVSCLSVCATWGDRYLLVGESLCSWIDEWGGRTNDGAAGAY